jgi:hypothetical protein
MDPKSRKTVNTSIISDSGGEVYDVAFKYGKVYAAAYAGGEIIRYDPGNRWDQWNHKNPKTIAKFGPLGYIRPTGGIVLGPDGKLYSGWMARYGAYGGAVAITDPISGRTDLLENPLGEQAVQGLAVDDRFMYVGTSLGGNGLPNKPGESAGFGMIDNATREVVFEHTFEGASHVRVLACDPACKRVIVSTSGRLHSFDADSREFSALDVPRLSCNSVASRDGVLYYGSDASIIALRLETGKAEKIADTAAKVDNVAVGPDGTIYFSSGVDVCRLKR